MIEKMVEENEPIEEHHGISKAIRISLNEENDEGNGSDEKSTDASYSSSLSFSSLNNNTDSSTEGSEKSSQKKKKDILHRDIEKRRRERINRSLVRLRELVPTTKDSMKCNSRLQKAKLLEMTVDYLSTLGKLEPEMPSSESKCKQQQQRKQQQQTAAEKSNPTRTVIAESAKEIYLTGYKAATDAILNKLALNYNISSETLDELRGKISLSSEVSVPNMLLVPPSPSPVHKESSDHKSEYSSEKRGSFFAEDETIGTFPPSSPIYQPAKMDSNPDTYNEKNSKHCTEEEQKMPMYSSSERNRFSPGISKGEETPEILLSCLVRDPTSLRYEKSLLPLNLLLSPEQRSPLSMSYLQNKIRASTESVLGSTYKQLSPSSLRKENPLPPPPPPTHHQQRIPSHFPRRAPPPNMPPSSILPSPKHNALFSTLKRKYQPDDRQIPVITNQLKPLPSLLPEFMFSQPPTTTGIYTSRNTLPPSHSHQNLISSSTPSYYQNVAVGMKHHGYNPLAELCNKKQLSSKYTAGVGRTRLANIDWMINGE